MKNAAYYLSLSLLIAGISFISKSSHAQSQFSSDWTLVKEQDGIKIYTKLASCDRHTRDEQMVFVKVENTNSEAAIVHYHLDQYYDGECKTCNDQNHEYSAFIDLGAGAIMQGSCGYAEKGLSAFAGWITDGQAEPLMLTKLEISDIDIRFAAKQESTADNPTPPADVLNDPQKYKAWKEQWIKEHPEAYEKTTPNAKKVISQSEFDNMPANKQQYILDNPDKYIVK